MKSPIKDLGNCHVSNAVVALELISWYHFDNRDANLFLGRLRKYPDHSCNNYSPFTEQCLRKVVPSMWYIELSIITAIHHDFCCYLQINLV